MQKVYLHLHKNVEKDKPKEPKTTPVPVNDPKKAGQVREADKKLFEKLNKIGAAIVIGLWLFTGVADQYKMNLGFDANPTHTPPRHHNQGLGGTVLPPPEVGLKPVQRSTTHQPKAADHPAQQITATTPVPVDTRCDFVLCEHISSNKANSPLAGVLETVINNWSAPVNTDILNVTQLQLEWKNELDFLQKLQEKNLSRPQTVVTLELQEFKESSGKDLYTLVPENKARIKLTMRGLDVASRRLIFEETIEKEVVQAKWANYEEISNNSQNDAQIYPYSLAMKQALLETSNEIITLLHKYFP